MAKLTQLHVITLDVPFPPNYGGVIDIYYRLKSLQKAGVKITLHCFEYGRGRTHDFSEIATEVFYYPRSKSPFHLLHKKPFIVSTRSSKKLEQRLLKDDFPILMEGHHCTSILSDLRFSDRQKWVRIHNIESLYYASLAQATNSIFKRWFFQLESKKLKKYEMVLREASALFCLSETDLLHYKTIQKNSFYWAAGCDFNPLTISQKASFALFHGNLSVEENEHAVRWIVENWEVNTCEFPLYIAGKSPRKSFKTWLTSFAFVTLFENPSDSELNHLIATASCNLLITFQATGVKLKLINALLKGNTCIVNPPMIAGTDLGQFCTIIREFSELKACLYDENLAVSTETKEARIALMLKQFDPDIQVETFFQQLKSLE
jgi:hypothetical protein